MKTNQNDPINPQRSGNTWGGLTKREHFAAMAMQGLCSISEEYPDMETLNEAVHALAKQSVAIADALIAALNKEVGS